MVRRGRWMAFVLCVTTLSVGAARVSGQEAPVPCKESACVLSIDWGAGKTSATYPPDRRYGSGDDFESRFKAALAERAIRFREVPTPDLLLMTVRPTMRNRVMCDRIGGLNRDMTCTAMVMLAVTFTSPNSGVKAPAAIRVSNRCAAGDIFLTHRDFATYAAEMIWYQLEGQAAKAERPRANC